MKIGEYLLQQLYARNVTDIFGVPGDYALKFFEQITKSQLNYIGTTREDTAGYAADAYARCKGLSAVVTTYGVGTLSTVNATAGAFAENSPVVVISGAPGVDEQRKNQLLHHRFGPYKLQRQIFKKITCHSAILNDPTTGFRDINRALNAAQFYHLPVYIELPRDIAEAEGKQLPPDDVNILTKETDHIATEQAVYEILQLLSPTTNAVIIAGVEIQRFQCQDTLNTIISKSGLPVATSLTGKSVVSERIPQYIGVYEGIISVTSTRELVENADLVIFLGVHLNDVDTGIFTMNIDPLKMVHVVEGQVTIGHHIYKNTSLCKLLHILAAKIPTRRKRFQTSRNLQEMPTTIPITVSTLIQTLNGLLPHNATVISDVGDSLFATHELNVHSPNQFIANAYYCSMGFSVPAALGVAVARPNERVICLIGDGSFQMTGTELSTISRLNLPVTTIVLNNQGYSTERFILDGPFNDIHQWNYHNIGHVFSPMPGQYVSTNRELLNALEIAVSQDRPFIINVKLPADQPSPALKRLSEGLKSKLDASTQS